MSILMNNHASHHCIWLSGAFPPCCKANIDVFHPVRLILLGPPGSGKGTRAEIIARLTGACHLSTGDIFRNAISTQTAPITSAMSEALTAMRKGELVQDGTVVDIVRERVQCLACARGFILDGFPRTVAQAVALESLLTEYGVGLDAVVNLRASDELIIERLSNRRVCKKCRSIWHIKSRPPKQADVCDACGGPLLQRSDDQPTVIQTRLSEYRATAASLEAFYRTRKIMHEVPASEDAEAVSAMIVRDLCEQSLKRG